MGHEHALHEVVIDEVPADDDGLDHGLPRELVDEPGHAAGGLEEVPDGAIGEDIGSDACVVEVEAGITTGVLLSTRSGTSLLAALPGSSHKLWARTLGSSGGAILAIAALTGAQLALGLIDRETAGRQLTTTAGGLVAGAATTGGMFAFAGLFTTATTGVQLGTLTGAAFKSAVLAFWGGGAKAAGGFGMAVGGPVIGAAAFAVSVAASATIGKVWREIDDGRRRRLIHGRWQVTMVRVRAGDQVEWRVASAVRS